MTFKARYDSIGKDYNDTRKPDKRIAKLLMECLDLDSKSTIIDIGAGTGNYTKLIAECDHSVMAVEPSVTMISKAFQHENIKWVNSTAEEIPSPDEFFDAAYCTLSMHHFTNQKQALIEIFRVLKTGGKYVAFTADPRRMNVANWMPRYFGPIYDKAMKVFPSTEKLIDTIKNISGSDHVKIIPFPLPPDLTDGFFCSSWRYPERYIDPTFRQGISHFQLAEKAHVQEMISKLRDDLETGIWDNEFGNIRKYEGLECGYFFVSATKELKAAI